MNDNIEMKNKSRRKSSRSEIIAEIVEWISLDDSFSGSVYSDLDRMSNKTLKMILAAFVNLS